MVFEWGLTPLDQGLTACEREVTMEQVNTSLTLAISKS
jgi:hypothetical protein